MQDSLADSPSTRYCLVPPFKTVTFANLTVEFVKVARPPRILVIIECDEEAFSSLLEEFYASFKLSFAWKQGAYGERW
jgi:hypothetical protein